MEWGKLFASLPDDPRVQAADDAELGAFGLLVQSMCYCTSAEDLTASYPPHRSRGSVA